MEDRKGKGVLKKYLKQRGVDCAVSLAMLWVLVGIVGTGGLLFNTYSDAATGDGRFPMPWWWLVNIYSTWVILAVGAGILIALFIRHDYRTFKSDQGESKEHFQ